MTCIGGQIGKKLSDARRSEDVNEVVMEITSI